MPPRNDTTTTDVSKIVGRWPPILQLAAIMLLASGGGNAITNGLFFGGGKLKSEFEARIVTVEKRVEKLETELTEIRKLLQEIHLELRDQKRRMETKGIMFKPQADFGNVAGETYTLK